MVRRVAATVGEIMQRNASPPLRGVSVAELSLAEISPMNGQFGRYAGRVATQPDAQQYRYHWGDGTPVEPTLSGRYPGAMESRVAVLKQIARTTDASLELIERRFEAVDRRIDSLTAEHRRDFRWLPGVVLGGFGTTLGVMALDFTGCSHA